MPGTLFVVATPIGNLEDLTFRALRTLKEADVIAAEDTRRTRKLLTHYGVSTPLVSLHEHNEFREGPRLVERLLAGETIAVVSDAGTPGISDPGAVLVRLAREAGVRVVPIPGPSAVTAALSVAGISFESFLFAGFPPPAGTARQEWFLGLVDEPHVLVFFEAPHRISKTMRDVCNFYPDRPIFISREITKSHEEFVYRPKNQPIQLREEGEFVIILGNAFANTGEIEPGQCLNTIGQLIEHGIFDSEEAIKAVGAVSGIPLRKLRNMVKRAEIEKRRQEEEAGRP